MAKNTVDAFLTATVVSIFVAASPATAGQSSSVVANGRQYFLKYCATCHGTSARGDGPAGENLRPRPADLTLLAGRSGGAFVAPTVERMIDGRDHYIKAHGSIDMPIWGTAFKREGLSEDAIRGRIEAIVDYLKSIQQRTT
jgi:mono/diheme cytochrome c family protein